MYVLWQLIAESYLKERRARWAFRGAVYLFHTDITKVSKTKTKSLPSSIVQGGSLFSYLGWTNGKLSVKEETAALLLSLILVVGQLFVSDAFLLFPFHLARPSAFSQQTISIYDRPCLSAGCPIRSITRLG